MTAMTSICFESMRHLSDERSIQAPAMITRDASAAGVSVVLRRRFRLRQEAHEELVQKTPSVQSRAHSHVIAFDQSIPLGAIEAIEHRGARQSGALLEERELETFDEPH